MNPHLTYWLAITHMPNIGTATLNRWLNLFPDIGTLFSTSEKNLRAAGLHPKEINLLKTPNWEAVEKDMQWCDESPDHHILTIQDEHYPRLLREISSAPSILYICGNPQLLSQPQIAVVGSRNPTHTGNEIAHAFSAFLAKAGFVITSGLASGIDAASHRGALSQKEKTIAVLGTGLDHTYPASHKKLAAEIACNGALVSEFSPATPAIAKNFPRRNRIISGLSLGVLVVEAAIHSGSLITARFAIEQGREVFAIPGSIHNPLSRGCHLLIRQGAKLVETAEHIVEELSAILGVMGETIIEKDTVLDPKQHALLNNLSHEPTPLDVLILRSGLTAGEVSSILLGLELRGYVQAVTGGYERIYV